MSAVRFDIAAYRAEVERAEAEALPALQRLMQMAFGDSGGERRVRLFLLGLYNGGRWKFDLTDLRAIDNNVLDDVFRVLKLDAYYCQREIHSYLENGARRIEALRAMETPEELA